MSRREIGFPRYVMEEAEGTEQPVNAAHSDLPGGSYELDQEQEEGHRRALDRRFALAGQLMQERSSILTDDTLSTKDKLRLLDSNRKTLVIATGGTIRKSENVVYAILLFGGTMVTVLALLTVFSKLPSEITLTFVGTVLGGTIATIAQKLGKL